MKPQHQLVAVIGALLLGCGGCGSGTLNIEVDAPSGVAPDLVVTGPNGYRQTVSKSGALSVAPGTYVLTAKPASIIGPVVEDLYDANPGTDTATLVAGGSVTLQVTYAHREGSGHLWVARESATGSDLGFFDAADLGGGFLSSTQGWPDAGDRGPESIAFDAVGNAWVSTTEGPIFRLSAVVTDAGTQWVSTAQLLSAVVSDSYVDAGYFGAAQITADGGIALLTEAVGMTFDSKGNLYVANCETPVSVLRYTASQLDTGGAQLPDLTLLPARVDAGTSLPAFICALALAFDAQGNLWMAEYGQETVVRYSNLASLHGPVAPMPDVVLIGVTDAGSDGGVFASIDGPNGLAFDTQGSLWIANWDGFSVARIDSPGSLSGIDVPAVPSALLMNEPHILIDGGTDEGGLFAFAAAVLFDNSGALWVASEGSATLARFTQPSALTGYSAPIPDRVVDHPALGNLNTGNQTFNPPPSNLPLFR